MRGHLHNEWTAADNDPASGSGGRAARTRARAEEDSTHHLVQRAQRRLQPEARRAHAREGGAVLALVTIAAAIGAAALETRRPDSRLRSLGKF